MLCRRHKKLAASLAVAVEVGQEAVAEGVPATAAALALPPEGPLKAPRLGLHRQLLPAVHGRRISILVRRAAISVSLRRLTIRPAGRPVAQVIKVARLSQQPVEEA